MATFVVEDGTGLPNASSYVTTLEADDYMEVKPESTWASLDECSKEQYLMWASRLLDQRVTWVGTKTVVTSGLRWPRSGVVDRDGCTIAINEVPPAVKAATIEVANHLYTQDVDPSAPSNAANAGDIKRIKADVIEIEYMEGTPAVAVDKNMFPLGLNQILSGLGVLSGTGGGMNFVRILKT